MIVILGGLWSYIGSQSAQDDPRRPKQSGRSHPPPIGHRAPQQFSRNRKKQHMKHTTPLEVRVPDAPSRIEGRVARLLLDMLQRHANPTGAKDSESRHD